MIEWWGQNRMVVDNSRGGWVSGGSVVKNNHFISSNITGSLNWIGKIILTLEQVFPFCNQRFYLHKEKFLVFLTFLMFGSVKLNQIWLVR